MRSPIPRSERLAPFVAPAFAAPAFAAIVALLAGCSQLDAGKVWPWSSTAKSEKPQPGRMTVVWTHATETESGRTMRGFRGRIFFFPKEKSSRAAKQADPEDDKPMTVEGTFTVYAFDVTGDGKLSSAAPRKFLFEPEKFKKQFNESKQGPCYQVWLPWDTVGGPPKHVNLWARFDGISHGAVVMSDNLPQLLPGVSQIAAVSAVAARIKTPSRQSSVAEAPHGTVAPASYEAPADPRDPSQAKNQSQSASSPAATDDWWK